MDRRVIVITGASGGLGQAVVQGFAREDVLLALVSRRIEPLEDLVRALALTQERVLCSAADLSKRMEAEQALRAVLDRFGRIDCLLHLVGTWHGNVAVADLADDDWYAMLETNLHAAFNIIRAALPAMLDHGGGRIVTVGSRAIERPGSGQAPYNVSKAALLALTRSVAADYGAQGIRANMILPGTIATPRQAQGSADGDRPGWVAPEMLAEMMVFLCGPGGDALNGAAIPVYGGKTL